MAGFIVVLVLIIAVGIGYLAWISRSKPWGIAAQTEPPPTEEELVQARLDLLRVELGASASLAKLEHRQAAERTKQAIADALESER